MIQGTTPTHKFFIDIATNLIDKLRISYEQNGKIVLRKETEDCQIDDGSVTTKLTQEDTLKFDAPGNVRIQIHALMGSESLVSKPVSVPVYILLDKAVL
jgi:hypothetical protein